MNTKRAGIILRILGICLFLGIAAKMAYFAHRHDGSYNPAIVMVILAIVFGLFPTPKVRL